MKVRMLVLSVLLSMVTAVTAAAQGGRSGNWELLGEQSVGFRVDTDVINIRQNEQWYRDRAYDRLRFNVERADLQMISIRIVYLNGYAEEIRIDQRIREGQGFPVDLPGRRSYIKAIEMKYRSVFGISLGKGGIKIDKAVVKVYGERVGPGRQAPPVAPVRLGPVAGWTAINIVNFDRQEQRVVLSVTKAAGSFSAIRLRAMTERVVLKEVRINFGNRTQQVVKLNEVLSPGEMSRPIDLEGQVRFINSVVAITEPSRRPGQASLQLLGTARKGADATRGRPLAGNWNEIGAQRFRGSEQRVVFRVARDEDRIGQIRLRAIDERLSIRAVNIRFRNGESHTVKLVDNLAPGQSTQAIDLPGWKRVVDTVTVVLEPGRRDRMVSLQLSGSRQPR